MGLGLGLGFGLFGLGLGFGLFSLGLGSGPGLGLGLGLGFGLLSLGLGLGLAVPGTKLSFRGNGWPDAGNHVDHDVVAPRFDAIIRGLPQGQDYPRAQSAPFILAHTGAHQPHGIGAGIGRNIHVAQPGPAQVHHHPRRLFQLPGGEGGPGGGRNHHRGIASCLRDTQGADLGCLGRGRGRKPGAHEDAEHNRGYSCRDGMTGHFSAPSGLTRMAFSNARVSPADVTSANSNTTRSDRIFVTRAADLER